MLPVLFGPERQQTGPDNTYSAGRLQEVVGTESTHYAGTRAAGHSTSGSPDTLGSVDQSAGSQACKGSGPHVQCQTPCLVCGHERGAPVWGRMLEADRDQRYFTRPGLMSQLSLLGVLKSRHI